MKRLLLALTLLVTQTPVFGMFKKQEEKKAKVFSIQDHLFYAARAAAPSAASALGAVVSFFVAKEVKNSSAKLAIAVGGNTLGLGLATYTQHVISEQEKKDEATLGQKVPYSVNSLPLKYLSAGISVVGALAVPMYHIAEQNKKIDAQNSLIIQQGDTINAKNTTLITETSSKIKRNITLSEAIKICDTYEGEATNLRTDLAAAYAQIEARQNASTSQAQELAKAKTNSRTFLTLVSPASESLSKLKKTMGWGKTTASAATAPNPN